MTTIYAACLARLGLSQSEAAALHGVRIDTVKSWSAGRNAPPASVFDELRAYEGQIVDRAEQMRADFDALERAEGEIGQINLDLTDADHLSAMAAADFVLGLDGVAVLDGKTEATIAARNLRKFTG